MFLKYYSLASKSPYLQIRFNQKESFLENTPYAENYGVNENKHKHEHKWVGKDEKKFSLALIFCNNPTYFAKIPFLWSKCNHPYFLGELLKKTANYSILNTIIKQKHMKQKVMC